MTDPLFAQSAATSFSFAGYELDLDGKSHRQRKKEGRFRELDVGESFVIRRSHVGPPGVRRSALAAKLVRLKKPWAILFRAPSLLLVPSIRPLVARSVSWKAKISSLHSRRSG